MSSGLRLPVRLRPEPTRPPVGTVLGSGEDKRSTRYAQYAAVVLVLALAPVVLPPYQVLMVSVAGIWCLALMWLNLIGGYQGQLDAAGNVYFGVGIYGTAILSHSYHVNVFVAVVVSVLLASLVKTCLGLVTARLSGLYLTQATLVVAILFPRLMLHFASVTGGSEGLSMAPLSAPSWFPYDGDIWRYAVVALVLLICGFVIRRIVKSSVGRSMAAMRDDELVCQAFGVNVWRAKIILGTVVGGGIGLAGALYVLIIGITSPTTVDVYLSIYLLISMVVGGARTLWGPALGGVFLQFFPIWTSGFFERSPELILGIVLILIVCVAPEGIAGSLKSYSGELRQRLAPSG